MFLKRFLLKMTQLIIHNILYVLYRIRGRHIIYAIITIFCYVMYTNKSQYKQLGKRELYDLIENHLQMNVIYEKGRECIIPNLDVFSEEVLDSIDLNYKPKIVCPGTDWVECHKSECYVTVRGLKNLVCTYMDIIFVRSDNYYLEDPVEVLGYSKYKLNKSDNVKISCKAITGTILGIPIYASWSGFKAGLRPIPVAPPKRKDTYNVLMLMFDSTSRNAFIRFMPRTYRYLTKEMNAVVLNGYSSVGDGTVANVAPILTGKSRYEMPEIRKLMVQNKYVDYKDFIFYQVKQLGYRTAYYEEREGTFTTYNNGFRVQPADHYLRALLLEVEKCKQKLWKKQDVKFKVCIGATPLYQTMLNLTRDLFELDGNKLSFTHICDISHEEINYIANAEDGMVDLLKSLKDKNVIEDTLIIVMGNYGQRFGKLRNTYQGKLEEYLPLMAIVLPERLKKLRPEALEALKQNKDVLTSHFDLHATLMDVLELPFTNKYVVPGAGLPRSISLLTKIPKSRTCSEAGIMPYFCACTHWYELPWTDDHYDQAVNAVVSFIDDCLSIARHKCARRLLRSVVWVKRQVSPEYMKMDDKLIHYFNHPEMKKPIFEYYQVKIVMSPRRATFEATLTHNTKLGYFDIMSDDISRTDSYGNESDCVVLTQPQLKKFCYCKN